MALAGVTGTVSVHLSAAMSGTADSALAAASDAPERWRWSEPLDRDGSRLPGARRGPRRGGRGLPGGGRLGGPPARGGHRTSFYVDTLDYLRRSGRIGAAGPLFGSALMTKPLLHIVDGHISPIEKARTSSRAIARLEVRAVIGAHVEPGMLGLTVTAPPPAPPCG
ncbi:MULTISPECIES: DegV family protein [unclassified Nonomuraea]|uniref:DegV family protein n=1 Tax=unclassified Nonomuraea TaxID=2593643 RepID=UPI001F455A9D|nr:MULTISPECIES: DegV family protein [unclassified Nonomuraea]